MNTKNKKRTLGASVLLLLVTALALGGSVFAYWVSTVKETDSQVTGGIGAAVETDAFLEAQTPTVVGNYSNLVPTTVTPGEGQSNVLVYTFTVDLKKGEHTSIDNLSGQVKAEATKEANVINDLINIEIAANNGLISKDNSLTFTVTVTMNEPKDRTEYEAVINQSFNFTMNFSFIEAATNINNPATGQ